MVKIGIDPSINSTGICVDLGDKQYIYYNIVSHATKKLKQFKHDNVYIIDYGKQVEKYDDYPSKEHQKTNNIFSICAAIKEIISKYNPDVILMEGVSYGSTGSAALVDLAGLNFAIRMSIRNLNSSVPLIIIPPTSVKKFAVANGQADKCVIVDAWKRIDKNIADITDIKIDDLADSFFISQYKE